MNWIQHPTILEGDNVRLIPLDNDHFPELIEVAQDKNIWEFISIDGSNKDVLLQHLRSAMLKRATGEQYAFTVIDRKTDKLIGCTLFHNIYAEHRKLEIGWTWYNPAYWRTGYNRECKLLLLTHCFEVLKAARVQLVTDENNQRSRTAILGIGAKMEGVMRKERIRSNGAFRNTVMYSIIDDEWPEVKAMLIEKMKR